MNWQPGPIVHMYEKRLLGEGPEGGLVITIPPPHGVLMISVVKRNCGLMMEGL